MLRKPIFDSSLFDPIIFDSLPRKVREIVRKLITRYLPRERRPFRMSIKIKGNPQFIFGQHLETRGSPAFSLFSPYPIIGSLRSLFSKSYSSKGSPSFLFESKISINGKLKTLFEESLTIQGNLSHKISKELEILGKKDFSKILFELLEEEEE